MEKKKSIQELTKKELINLNSKLVKLCQESLYMDSYGLIGNKYKKFQKELKKVIKEAGSIILKEGDLK